jgi:hypothetical protein
MQEHIKLAAKMRLSVDSDGARSPRIGSAEWWIRRLEFVTLILAQGCLRQDIALRSMKSSRPLRAAETLNF